MGKKDDDHVAAVLRAGAEEWRERSRKLGGRRMTVWEAFPMQGGHNAMIGREADDLLAVMDALIPETTIHPAVENARKAVRELLRVTEEQGIFTFDKEGRGGV
jgi:hypothetical protein